MCDKDCLHARSNGNCDVGETPECCQMFISNAEYDAYIDQLMSHDAYIDQHMSKEERHGTKK